MYRATRIRMKKGRESSMKCSDIAEVCVDGVYYDVRALYVHLRGSESRIVVGAGENAPPLVRVVDADDARFVRSALNVAGIDCLLTLPRE